MPVALSMFHLVDRTDEHLCLAGYNRLLGAYKNLHNHALMMMFIVTMATWWWFQAKERSTKTLIAVYGLMAATAMALTYVRTAQVALVCSSPLPLPHQ